MALTPHQENWVDPLEGEILSSGYTIKPAVLEAFGHCPGCAHEDLDPRLQKMLEGVPESDNYHKNHMKAGRMSCYVSERIGDAPNGHEVKVRYTQSGPAEIFLNR